MLPYLKILYQTPDVSVAGDGRTFTQTIDASNMFHILTKTDITVPVTNSFLLFISNLDVSKPSWFQTENES